MLARIDDGHVDRLLHELRQLHGNAVEGVKRIALLLTPRTRERRAKLCLEHGLNKRIIAPDVIRERFRRNHLIWTAVVVLQRGGGEPEVISGMSLVIRL